MAEASAVGRGWTWSIGSALTSAGSILLSHFMPFVAVALIGTAPNVLFWFWAGPAASRGLLTTTGIASMLVNTAILVFVIQTLVYGAVQALRGRTVSIGDCLTQGIRRLPAEIVIGFVAYIGILLGMILLFVPGLILLTMWAIALPANTWNEPGSWSRSRAAAN